MEDRNKLAATIEPLGEALAAVRDKLAEADYGFCVGLVRAAEEALLVACTSLRDSSVEEEQL